MNVTWRLMLASDIAGAHALSEIVHPGYPEDRAVFEERHRLHPAGCFVLAGDEHLFGYALSHPYATDCAPSLNALLGELPQPCDTFYIHDIAILPKARGSGAGNTIVSMLKAHAREAGFDTVCLVAVNNSAPFWMRHGFAAREIAALRGKLGSYGEGVVYMSGRI